MPDLPQPEHCIYSAFTLIINYTIPIKIMQVLIMVDLKIEKPSYNDGFYS